jgi:Amidohydrolase
MARRIFPSVGIFRKVGFEVEPYPVDWRTGRRGDLLAWAEFESTGRIQWATDLAEIPQKFGVTNVHAELGTSFANSAVAHPKFCAALVGTLIKGMGVDHVLWGTDSVWYGSPQWQIEALRRLEIPYYMQKKYGFAPLGGADSAIKQLIFGGNAARMYRINLKAADNIRMPTFSEDRLAALKSEYELAANEPSNLRYGYVRPPDRGFALLPNGFGGASSPKPLRWRGGRSGPLTLSPV